MANTFFGSTPAPEAMKNMGAGLIEAGANIGRMQEQGYAALGQGIGQGIQSLGKAYNDYKENKAHSDMAKTILGSKSLSGSILGIQDDEERKKLLDQYNQGIKENGLTWGSKYAQDMFSPMIQNAQLGAQLKSRMAIEQMQQGGMNVRQQNELNQQRANSLFNLLTPTPPQQTYRPTSFGASQFDPQQLNLGLPTVR